MKLTVKIAVIALIALLSLPVATTGAYADDNDRHRCEEQSQDDCDSKRKKPKFQTKFFSN